jgi:DnaJ-class molecular chaperone
MMVFLVTQLLRAWRGVANREDAKAECPDCGGKGGWPIRPPLEPEEYEGCLTCNGTGKVEPPEK